MKPCKLVVLGGSGVATPGLAAALAENRNRKRSIRVVLVGRSHEKLELVTGISRLMTDGDPLITFEADTNPENALADADIVLNQIRVGGLEARSFDESFPYEFGLPGEETVGPGGFANASRTIPVVLEYARLIERVCPDATLLSFSNPASLVQRAITTTTKVNTIGLCDGPVALIDKVAGGLGISRELLVVDYIGMHHFGWVTGVWHQGKNIIDRALDVAERINSDVDLGIIRALRAIPGPYHQYFFHTERILAAKAGKPTRASELLQLQDALFDEYKICLKKETKPEGLKKRKAVWYKAVICPVIVALSESSPEEAVINIRNGQTIAWLPEDAIVEVPSMFRASHVQPFSARSVPTLVKALIQRNCEYERAAVDAILARDEQQALGALLLNPMIKSGDQAKKTLEKAWG